MRRNIIGSIAASAAAAAVLLGSATAVSASHTVELLDIGRVEAKGAAIVVPVEVTCQPTPYTDSLWTAVTQRAGNRIAQGGAYTGFECTGAPQVVEVRIVASQVPFKPGTALASVEMTQCNSFQCHTVTDSEEIQLRK